MRHAAVFLVIGLSVGGCVSPVRFKFEPGAEKIYLTQNPDQVRGAILIKTATFTLYSPYNLMRIVDIYARNFTHGVGGDIAFISVISSSAGQYGTLHVTVEAYRKGNTIQPPQNPVQD